MKYLDPIREIPIDPMVVTVASALLTHLYFKRYEPQSPKHTLSILLGIPSFLLLLDACVGSTPPSSRSTWKALEICGAYFATLIGSIATYRISPFHPLAKYPGPFAARLSKLWMTFVCSGGKQHEYYANLHKKYGNIVRIGPNEVIIRDPAAIMPLMGTAGWGKGKSWAGRRLGAPVPSLIGIRDGSEHAKRRRTWNRGFNPTAMRQYEPMVRKRVLELLEVIAQGGRIDLSELFGYFAFDIMEDMALGGGTNLLREGDSNGIWHLIEVGMRTAALIGHIPWIGIYLRSIPGLGTGPKRLQAFSMQKFLVRKNEGFGKKDLFYHLADEAGIEKQPVSTPVALSDATLVIVAGSDTTSTVLSSLFFYLLQDQKKFERLRAEIDKFYPRGKEITTEHFDEMDYLDACVNEALRLSPPVPSGSPRAASDYDPSGGKMVGPYYIPTGNVAAVNFLAIQRDPRNFSPSPDAFWPDRWLVAKGLIESPVPEGEFVHDASAFVPFSFGPRICVGKPLALLELRMTTANLVREVDLKFAPGYKETWESDLQDFFVVQRGKLPVIATPRA